MIQDPLTVWNGQFPYDALAAAGITPESAHADVEDATYTLMANRLMTPAVQKAWQELRDVRRRLLVDLLLYDVDLESEIGHARARIHRELSQQADPDTFPPRQFIDSLIHFDR